MQLNKINIHMSALLYARVSTTEQAEHDLSIPAQFNAMRAKARELNCNVVHEFLDIGSGKHLKDRPGLLAAVKFAVEHDTVNIMNIHRIDRFARNAADYHLLKAKLLAAGVRIVSIVEHIDESPAGEFMENIFAAYAEFYSANLSLEVKKGMVQRLKRGEWIGPAPLGYIVNNGALLVDPARARFIREAFHRYATEAVSMLQLTKDLHAQGLVARTWCGSADT